jgi:hypothetical protein
MRTGLAVLSVLMMVFRQGGSQVIQFEFEKVPVESGFRMDGYWVWGGSMIRVDSTYHLFASRWVKKMDFPREYRFDSEIVRATSASPAGPFRFEELVIGERDSAYWDANMAHNPTIHKIGDEYVLFYIGSDFTTYRGNTGNLLRRVGYASAKSIEGPWKRSDEPVIPQESNNPAVLMEDSRVLLLFRDASLRVYMAASDHYKGPFEIVNDNVWPECKLEDFYLFKANDQYHFVCEDNAGAVSGHERWGVLLCSDNGVNAWKGHDPVVVYDHDIAYDDGRTLHCVRRERPQLLIEEGKITHLITGVYDGTNSWCQPIALKKAIPAGGFSSNDPGSKK